MATIRIDFSTANDLTCETRAFMKYVLRRRRKGLVNAPMRAGSLVHEAVEAFLCQQHFDVVSAYAQYFPEPPQEERLSLQNLTTILWHWSQYRALEGWPFEIVSTEQAFTLPEFFSGVDLFGRIDGIVRAADDSLYILETKTTGHLDALWIGQWQTSPQLLTYLIAARKLYPHLDIKGAFVNALELSLLPPYDGNMDRKCSKHGAKYNECQFAHMRQALLGPILFTTSQQAMWERQMRDQAWRFRMLHACYADQECDVGRMVPLLEQEGMFTYAHRGNLCSGCEYKEWCWTLNRDVRVIDQIFEEGEVR